MTNSTFFDSICISIENCNNNDNTNNNDNDISILCNVIDNAINIMCYIYARYLLNAERPETT